MFQLILAAMGTVVLGAARLVQNYFNQNISLNSIVIRCSEANVRAEIRSEVELGADINQKNTFGYTPLHCAALHGKVQAAKLLIELGADINVIAMGCTPLVLAAQWHHLEIAKILIASGAEIDTKFSFTIQTSIPLIDATKMMDKILAGNDLPAAFESKILELSRAPDFVNMIVQRAKTKFVKSGQNSSIYLEHLASLKEAAHSHLPDHPIFHAFGREIEKVQLKKAAAADHIKHKRYVEALPLIEKDAPEYLWVKAIAEIGGISRTYTLKQIFISYSELRSFVGRTISPLDLKKLETIAKIAKLIIDRKIDLFSEPEKELVNKIIRIHEIRKEFDEVHKELETLTSKLSKSDLKHKKSIHISVAEARTNLIKIATILTNEPYAELEPLKASLIIKILKVNRADKSQQHQISLDGLEVFTAYEAPAPAIKPTQKEEFHVVSAKLDTQAEVHKASYLPSINTLREYAKAGCKKRAEIEKDLSFNQDPTEMYEEALKIYVEEHKSEVDGIQNAIRQAYKRKVSAYFIIELLSNSDDHSLKSIANSIRQLDVSDGRSTFLGAPPEGSILGDAATALGKEAGADKPDIANLGEVDDDSDNEDIEDLDRVHPLPDIISDRALAILTTIYTNPQDLKTDCSEIEELATELGFQTRDTASGAVFINPEAHRDALAHGENPVGAGASTHRKHESDQKRPDGLHPAFISKLKNLFYQTKNKFLPYLDDDASSESSSSEDFYPSGAELTTADRLAGFVAAEEEPVMTIKEALALFNDILNGNYEQTNLINIPRAYIALGLEKNTELFKDIASGSVYDHFADFRDLLSHHLQEFSAKKPAEHTTLSGVALTGSHADNSAGVVESKEGI